MKKQVSIFLLLITSVIACTSSQENNAAPRDLRGNWVDKAYIEALQLNHSPKTINDEATYYVTEFVIDDRFGDSIVVYNGQLGYAVLPVQRSGDTLRVKLNQDSFTEITYDEKQKTLVFTDKKLNRVFRFVRADSKDIDPGYDIPIAFPTIVNNATFTGSWDFYEHESTQKTVQFTDKGKVTGWEGYTDYSVCTNGDCAVNDDGDVVVVTSNSSVVHAYGFRSKGDTLTVYDLSPKSTGKYGMGRALGVLVKKGN